MSTAEMVLLMGCSHIQASKVETVPVPALPGVWCGCAVRLQLLVDCCDATTGHWYTHTWYMCVHITYELYNVAVGNNHLLLSTLVGHTMDGDTHCYVHIRIVNV